MYDALDSALFIERIINGITLKDDTDKHDLKQEGGAVDYQHSLLNANLSAQGLQDLVESSVLLVHLDLHTLEGEAHFVGEEEQHFGQEVVHVCRYPEDFVLQEFVLGGFDPDEGT